MASAVTRPESSASGRIFRFGAFEFCVETRELRKHGLRIKLSGQPASVLAMLVERPGEVITREELRKRLWPDGTYVDFEHSVNTAVKRLRQALGDSADAPRFIETLARNGYRFIAPVSQAAQPSTRVSILPRGRPHAGVRAPRVLVPFAILSVVVGVLAGLHEKGRPPVAPGPIRSLAVLPLANLSGDPGQEYFAEGVADVLRQDLEGIRALRVVSRTSSMYYRGSHKPLPDMARQMDVDAVVDGSVLRSGNRVRISVELIQAANDTRLWGDTYDRDLKDVFALQSEVARRIADEIQVTLTPHDRARLAHLPTPDPDAYLAYSKGRFFWNRRTEVDLKRAIGYFQQAIAKDPNYALAYDGLADCWLPLGWYAYMAPADTFPQAKAAVRKALALDDSLAEAHTSLAFVTLYYDRDWAGAEQEFRRAIDLNPNYANGHHWYAEFLSLVGRHKEAIAESERARELDPLSTIINTWVGSRYFFARHYDEAIEQYRNAVEMDPSFVPVHLVLGHAFEQKHLYAEAIAELERAVTLSGGSPVYRASLAHAYGVSGRRDEARKLFDDLRNLSKRRHVSSYDLALAALGVGAIDQSFSLLARAVDERSPRVAFLTVDPRFDGLRSDARFKALMVRIGR
ncbi:MAG TPA: winged helix-turn-helix domain-containing protein [Bryobacteraceae bacterium]|jgi:TolB-like protein/DNA-binding winged helix-turn-helix (wHTH) protein/Tfp pilus assembly protein PilF|nr:winged helix-turn-helix domain-containing protein [Bryobacteraceae bacterium]